MSAAPIPPAPIAERRPTATTHHGFVLGDDYAWLRADNWQQVMRDPGVLAGDIRAHLEAENAYTQALLADTTALQETLFAEMKGRIKEDDSQVPSPDGAWAYYSSYVTGGQYPRLCRRPREGGEEAILLDGNLEADGKSYWQLGGAAHSPDHRLLAYAVDEKGSELFTIRIRDLSTGADLADEIRDTRGGLVWSKDSATLFYVRVDDNQRPQSIHRHRLGSPVETDVTVYTESDPGFFAGVSATQSGDYILIDAHDHETSEIYLIDARNVEAPMRVIAPRRPGHEYDVDHIGSDLAIRTNSQDAEDFRICLASVADPGEGNWREIVPHEPGRLILSATALAGHIVRLERAQGLPRIIVRRMTDGGEHAIAFPEEAYALSLSAGYEHATTAIRFTYASPTTPTQVFDYDVETRERVLRKTQEVPSGHDRAHYVTRRVLAPARDGETVPVTLLHHRETPLDGTAPLLLYGYGSYGITIPSGFSTARLSLVDRGVIYAIAHVRGGKDKGYGWYRQGKRRAKLNTFTDFIDAGEHLVRLGLTQRGRIIGQGGSAGGMLMGAVANMAPDLFLGIIADVPFVDVLNTMLDDTLPLTPPEWPEWGNPIASAEDFALIRAYSPYDNVAAQAYPHILALAGLTDPRVTYWEPAKWVAKLRAHTRSENLILLKTNMDAGHGGASGRFEALRETALEYAFALKIAGLTGRTPSPAA